MRYNLQPRELRWTTTWPSWLAWASPSSSSPVPWRPRLSRPWLALEFCPWPRCYPWPWAPTSVQPSPACSQPWPWWSMAVTLGQTRWGKHVWGDTPNIWMGYVMENPVKMDDDWGYPEAQETTTYQKPRLRWIVIFIQIRFILQNHTPPHRSKTL